MSESSSKALFIVCRDMTRQEEKGVNGVFVSYAARLCVFLCVASPREGDEEDKTKKSDDQLYVRINKHIG